MLISILTVIYVIVCFTLMISILLQSGQGGGLGAGFGGAGSAATEIFGGRGAGSFLSRVSVVTGALYMCLSLGLAYLSSKPQSALDLSGPDTVQRDQEEEVIEEGTLDVKLSDIKTAKTPTVAPKKPATPGAFTFQPGTKPADTKPADTKPVDTNPTDTKVEPPTPGTPGAKPSLGAPKLELKLGGDATTPGLPDPNAQPKLKLGGDDTKLQLKLNP